MRKKIIGVAFITLCFVAVGIYFWGTRVDKNQAHINKIFDIARKMIPVSEDKEQDVDTEFIKKIENLLVDYTTQNEIKKTIKNFLQKTVGQTIDESNIQGHGTFGAPAKGLSGNPLFFIRNKQDSLMFVIKVFSKPFDPNENFIKEIAGFDIVSTMQGKNFHLISVKAIGKCNIDGEKYGLLAFSPAVGANMQELVIKMLRMQKESKERANVLRIAKRALEKLGAALAEFHRIRTEKSVPLHPAVIKHARHHLKLTIDRLEHEDHGIEIQDLQNYFDNLAQRMKKIKTTRSIIHRDANLGNFLYDEKTDTLSMVDYNELYHTVDQEGNPIWHAAFDFMTVLDIIATNKKYGLTEKEYNTLNKAFIKGYGSLPTSLEQEFFALVSHLNIAGWFWMMEKEHPEQFASEKIQVISIHMFEEIKKSLVKFQEISKQMSAQSPS
ncbi:phosphotransferase [Candidatus Dependentiae bacterium]